MDLEALKGLNSDIVAFRRRLHSIPEVGLDLPKTRGYVREVLQSLGYQPRDCGYGLICDIGSGPGLLAMRADMDALPVQEQTGVAYASIHAGTMHACGHDAHTAVLLGIAKYFAANPPPYRVRLIFQPGEEGYFGAVNMIENGALDGVSAIIGGHVGQLFPDTPPGVFVVKSGSAMAASDDFRVVFQGKGTHGSQPQTGRDPFMAAAAFILGTQVLKGRETDPNKPSVISVGTVHGGTAYNIIPDSVEITGTVRTIAPSEREQLAKRLKELAEFSAAAYGLSAEFTYNYGYIPLVNDATMVELFMRAVRETLGEDRIVTVDKVNMGGEDMAYYLQKVPGVFYFFNTNNANKGIVAPNHNPKFDVDEEILWMMAAANIRLAELFYEGRDLQDEYR
ncbi:amidohydrolase [Coprothermobacteraceae bacterium]|nr:amidohydrolase [Coprothermobacteraceae bacterium]